MRHNLDAHDRLGERSIAVAQGAIVAAILLLDIVARLETAEVATAWMLLILGVLTASAGLRWHLARAAPLPHVVLDALNVFDAALLLLLTWICQRAHMPGTTGISLSPSLGLLYLLVASRSLRFHPRPILTAGATVIAGWALILIVPRLLGGGHGAHGSIPWPDTLRLFGITALSIVLALAIARARQMLTRAAHADDHAEALDAVRRHLQEAVAAREAAEAAEAAVRLRDTTLSQQNERISAALSHMSEGLCMFDKDKRLVICNPRYAELYRLPSELVRPGVSFRQIIEHRVANGIYVDDPDHYLRDRIAATDRNEPSYSLQTFKDGRVIAVSHRPMRGGGWLATHQDITELQRVEARIVHMAHHDVLTDLPNRFLLRQRLMQSLDELKAGTRAQVAVFAIDLDRFKAVNDTFGHATGDKLLEMVAQRLRASIGERDTVARLGGDEFAILHVSGQDAAGAAMLAARVRASIAAPYDLAGHVATIDASIGIALAPADGNAPDALLKHADLALYRAKSYGCGQFRFFKPDMAEHVYARPGNDSDLLGALERGELALHYQPIVDLARDTVVGAEAVLCLPDGGCGISPATSLSLATDAQLVMAIGEWTLRQACRHAASWPAHVRVAVNIPALLCRSGTFAQSVLGALAATGLHPSRLEIEIAETALVENATTVLSMLHQLRQLGVRIVLDDFGTGHYALSDLSGVPFDKIKIGHAVVSSLADSGEQGLAILRSIVQQGRGLGIETAAAGVQTAAQRDVVRSEGCVEAQGDFLGQALPAEAVTHMLREAMKTAESDAA